MLPPPPADARRAARRDARQHEGAGVARRGRRSNGTSRSTGSRPPGSSSSSSSRSSMPETSTRPHRSAGPSLVPGRPAPSRRSASTAMTRPRGRRSKKRSASTPGATARIEDRSHRPVSSSRASTSRPNASCGAEDAVVAVAVPPADLWQYVCTLSRTPQHRSASSFQSCQPCHAIGERGVFSGSLLDDQRAPRDRLGVAFADGQRVARIGLVAAGHDERRRP